MLPVATPEEMAAIDAASTESYDVLVGRAGAAVASAAIDMLGGADGRRVVVVAGGKVVVEVDVVEVDVVEVVVIGGGGSTSMSIPTQLVPSLRLTATESATRATVAVLASTSTVGSNTSKIPSPLLA